MESLNLIKNDPWLAPYEAAIEGRYQYVIDKEKSLTNNGKLTLSEMASGYLYFGLHKTTKGWVFREWAPNATAIYLIGTFNGWQKDNKYKLKRKANGVWEIALTDAQMYHEDLFKLLVEWDAVAENVFPHGLAGWCKMSNLRYSALKYGTRRNLINSRINGSNLRSLPF